MKDEAERDFQSLTCLVDPPATAPLPSHRNFLLFFKVGNYFCRPFLSHPSTSPNITAAHRAFFFTMGTGKKEANRKIRQGKVGDGMANVKVKGENFYR